MQARVDWVQIIFGTQVIKTKWPVRPVFPDYLSVSYDSQRFNSFTLHSVRSFAILAPVTSFSVRIISGCLRGSTMFLVVLFE